MNHLQLLLTRDQIKARRKLALFTVLVLAVIAGAVFFALNLHSIYREAILRERYLHALPEIIQDRQTQFEARQRVYDADIIIRGRMGLLRYQQEKRSGSERLAELRDAVSASAVSIVDSDMRLVETTDPAEISVWTPERLRALVPETPYIVIPSPAGGDEQEERIGTGYILFQIPEEDGRSLLFEFDCSPLLQTYAELSEWSGVLERTLAGLDAWAFICYEGSEDFDVYPLDGITQDNLERLGEELAGILRERDSFVHLDLSDELSIQFNLIQLLDRNFAAIWEPYPEQGMSVLLAVPIENFGLSGLFAIAALVTFIALSLVLYQRYAMRRIRQLDTAPDKRSFPRQARRALLPGLLIVLGASVCFAVMLFRLESRSETARTALKQRETLQLEIADRERQAESIRKEYTELYLKQAEILSAFLTEHPEEQTRAMLRELCGIVQADYLMLFDRSGQELFSSNTYVGFSAGGKEDSTGYVWRPVLMGYPSLVNGPTPDPVTGQMQLMAAALITGEDGLPDGFLLAAFGADELTAQLESVGIESTVNDFALQAGHAAAVADESSGRFIAHTDPDMIGREVTEHLNGAVLGHDHEGFVTYDGKTAYLSARAEGGLDLLFFAMDQYDMGASAADFTDILLFVVLLSIALLYYPVASKLCIAAAGGPGLAEKGNPLLVFLHGYAGYFTVLAAIGTLTTQADAWPAFNFVFGGQWSKGVHLFSLWAALFVLSATLCTVFILRGALARLNSRLSLQAKTISRLADSLILYAAVIISTFRILSMFGVDTTALLASAGIVSIAVGMGAQELIADILAGLFMLMEGSIHVGDEVTVGGWTGRVTDMGVRTTEITDEERNVMIISNSRISDMVNKSKAKAPCTLELEFPRAAEPKRMDELLRLFTAWLNEQLPALHGSLRPEGIVNITENAYIVRLSFSCAEQEREEITRSIREAVRDAVQED